MPPNKLPDLKKRKSIPKLATYIIFLFFITALVLFEYFFAKTFCSLQKEDSGTQETEQKTSETHTTNGLLLLTMNEENTDGIIKWEKELDKRGITAVVKPKKEVLESNAEVFKRLQNKGYEIATGYGDEPCWDMSYKKQYNIMKKYIDSAEKVLGKQVRIYSCKYFSYDENTLKAADELGVEYLLGRGTQHLRAVIYKPEEYNVKVISVSNLEFADMGSGSLCDVSLYSRGANADDFDKLLQQSLNMMHDNLILVSHVYIGGTRQVWWDAYERGLDSDNVTWRSFNDWTENLVMITLPNEDIPLNTEVQYMTPKISVPIEDLELVTELQDDNEKNYVGEKLVMYHNGTGPMCLDAMEFLKTIDYPVEQHLTTEADFYNQLQKLQSIYGTSEGKSTSYGYFPIIFIKDKAFSGFDETIKDSILKEITNT